MASSRFASLILFIALCAQPFAARAEEERYDHRGAVGLLLGVGGEAKSAVASGGSISESGQKLLLELGGTVAVGYNGNELLAMLRTGRGGRNADYGAFFGYRGYFGLDRVKTFFDMDAAVQWVPNVMFTVGPRFGVGVQFEILSLLGAYVALAGQAGFGGGVHFSGELTAGIQLRSYWLE
ncbi:MAG: hypothetical protein ACT4TC_17785 [Myxococcaceae bacterium]